MSPLAWVAFGLLFLWALWGVYVLVMGLYRAHLSKRLGKVALVLSLPFVVLGFAMDFVANVFLASVIFLEPPREWLVTDRLQRHMTAAAWRGRLARWICSQLLDVFDPTGAHCD